MNRRNFPAFLDSIKKGYNFEYLEKLPTIKDFTEDLFEYDFFVIENINIFLINKTDPYLISVSKRMVAISTIQKARENNLSLDIDSIWGLISESISIIPSDCTISSIGSQGFLSIPLYKSDSDINNFDFIRLHIWDNVLSSYINFDNSKKFSIHTHTFYAKSWIITGKILNERYNISIDDKNQLYSLFSIQYNDSLNSVNQHTSKAINTNAHVNIKKISHELYYKNGSYEIRAGDYHKSEHENGDGISATIFSFTSKEGLVDKSYVVGPREISDSTINRKMHIDPALFLNKIDFQLKNDR